MKKRTPRWFIERQFSMGFAAMGIGVGFIILGIEVLDLPKCFAALFMPVGLFFYALGMCYVRKAESPGGEK